MLGARSVRINGVDCGAEALVLAAVTSLGGFVFGYDIGQISGLLLSRDFISRFGQADAHGNRLLDATVQSLLVSLMSVGCLVGALSGAYTADWWGRRRSLTFGAAVYMAGGVVQMTAVRSWRHVAAGRLVAGLGVGSLSVGVPMFQSEAAPREIRGAVVASYQLMITLGILAANAVHLAARSAHPCASWRVVMAAGAGCALPLAVGVAGVPESPRWLAGRGDWPAARRALARLRGLGADAGPGPVDDDVAEMRAALAGDAAAGSWLDCFTPRADTPRLVYRTLLGAAVHCLQQWTGVNYFFYYGAAVFQAAGVDAVQTQLILGAVNMAATVLGIYVVERYGRRAPLFLGALWQAAALCLFATAGTLRPPSQSAVSGVVMTAAACLFIASFACSWGPMAWVVVGEMFPLRTRAKQASLATAANWLGNFMIGIGTPLAAGRLSYALGYVFAATNLVAAAVVWFFLYESRMLSLESVDLMYSEQGLRPWRSARWVPPGYVTRKQKDEAHVRPRTTSLRNKDDVEGVADEVERV